MNNKVDKIQSQGQSQGKSKSRERNQCNYKDGGQIARGRICPTTSSNNPKTGIPLCGPVFVINRRWPAPSNNLEDPLGRKVPKCIEN